MSELRPVTIVFVNLVFKDQDKAEVIGSAIQDACVHISSVLRVFRGQINKVFMFDKVGVSDGAGPSAGERGDAFTPKEPSGPDPDAACAAAARSGQVHLRRRGRQDLEGRCPEPPHPEACFS